MDCIDVFSGIGGISLALQDYMKTILYCEINPFCQQVLAERMQDGILEKAPIHNNICNLHIGGHMKPTWICGGFPCQDISSMGLQKGVVDSERSSLFFEIMRIVEECPSIQYLFLENVANITKCGMKDVIQELVNKGFNCQWMMKSASSMGAPHQRNRWFCLASKASDHSALQSISEDTCEPYAWNNESYPRISFKPGVLPDESFDEYWIQRSQCLGNSVVPCVVKSAFQQLISGCVNWSSIFNGLHHCAIPFDKLEYPFPESGMIFNKLFIPLPNNAMERKHEVQINIKHCDKDIKLVNFPTPRRGITHASSLTERSIKDLPTLLTNCNESLQYIATKGINVSDKPHSYVIANVNYVEWMMGYPKDWTRVRKYKKQIRHEADDTKSVEVDPPIVPTVKTSTRRYNGMHVLMREMIGKDIREVAKAWRSLTAEQKKNYSERASSLLSQ